MWQVEYLETFYFKPQDYVLVMPVFAVEVPREATITLNHEHTDYRWVPEPHLESSFMWCTQREALRYLLEGLRKLASHGIPVRQATLKVNKSSTNKNELAQINIIICVNLCSFADNLSWHKPPRATQASV